MGIEQNGRTPRLVLHVHAVLQLRPVGHDRPPSRDRTVYRAGRTKAHPRQLARMLPCILPTTTNDFADECALTLPVGPNGQNMLPQLDRPGDLAVDDEILSW